ncbi:MAG TPA: four helix bundle protein [Pyrinomonadaceae bacterium]|jgi:four helix bundle protein
MAVQSYRQLIAWQKAMALVKQIYSLIKDFPKEEIYGLTSQIRRAAVSITSNIAEGQGRDSTKEFLHYLSIAYGSLMEVETQILIAESLNYLKSAETKLILEKTAETGRQINGLSRSLKQKSDH